MLAEETASINNIQKLCQWEDVGAQYSCSYMLICVARVFVFKKQFNYLL